MVLIPAGKFMMGSPKQQSLAFDETQHKVIITKPYFLGKYVVTQEQWKSLGMENLSCYEEGASLPVTNVSWDDCQEFIKKLNFKTKGGYRLPTEAEWEYACRAGTTTAYSFGNDIEPKDANYVFSMIGEPVLVGSYKPNAFGLHEMHGNVWEWCEDWYGEFPVRAVTDPKGPATGKGRVLRGGFFHSGPSDACSFSRYVFNPAHRYRHSGFRLARTK